MEWLRMQSTSKLTTGLKGLGYADATLTDSGSTFVSLNKTGVNPLPKCISDSKAKVFFKSIYLFLSKSYNLKCKFAYSLLLYKV